MQTPKTARQIAERHADVVRILSAQPFARRTAREVGFDGPEELAQEVLALILRYEARGMASRYDPERSAWTTYVVMVARGLVKDRLASHIHRRGVHAALSRCQVGHGESAESLYLEAERQRALTIV